MKKGFGFFIVFFIVLTLVTISFATSIDEPSDWAKNAVNRVKINPKYSDSTIFNNYQEKITRKDFAYISVKLYEELTNSICLDGANVFNDTKDAWVLKAKRYNLVSGVGNDRYAPNQLITREQLAVLMVNLLKSAKINYATELGAPFTDDHEFSNWAKEAVYIARSNNLINGMGNNIYASKGFASKEQALIMITKVLDQFRDQIKTTSAVEVTHSDSSNDLEANIIYRIGLIFDPMRNNYIFKDGGSYYVVSLSERTMLKKSDLGLEVYIPAKDDLDIQLFKYNESENSLTNTQAVVLYNRTDYVNGSNGIYKYDPSSTSVKKRYDLESGLRNAITNTATINKEYTIKDATDHPKVYIDYKGSNYFVLQYHRLTGNTQFVKIDMNPFYLLGSQILVSNNYVYDYDNDGQFALVGDKKSIVYWEDHRIEPQFIQGKLDPFIKGKSIEYPLNLVNQKDVLFYKTLYKNSADENSSLYLNVNSEKLKQNEAPLLFPSFKNLGFDIMEFSYTNQSGEDKTFNDEYQLVTPSTSKNISKKVPRGEPTVEMKITSLMDPNKNNSIIKDDTGYYVLSLSNKTMFTKKGLKYEINIAPTYDYEISVAKYNEALNALEKTPITVYYNNSTPIIGENDVYRYDHESIRDNYWLKEQKQTVHYGTEIVVENTVTLVDVVEAGTVNWPLIMVDFGGKDKVKLNFTKTSDKVKFSYINIDPLILEDSYIITDLVIDGNNVWPNSGQYAMFKEKAPIVFNGTCELMPQVVSNSMVDFAKVDAIEFPKTIYKPKEIYEYYVEYSKPDDPFDVIYITYIRKDLTDETSPMQVPSFKHLGYSKMKFSYRIIKNFQLIEIKP